MSTQPEALRLADLWEKHSHGYARTPEARTAAELRRLSIENEALGLHLSERMKDLARVEAQRDALLGALKMIAGTAPCIDNLMSDKDIARAAIKAVEGEGA